MAESDEEKLWQTVYNERAKLFEENIGPLPDDILKLGHMTGVWPGGGLYTLEAKKLGDGLWLHTTFGLTNPDMPTTVSATNIASTREEGQTSSAATLVKKDNVPSYPGRAGYGYEIMLLTKESAEWPLWLLQWAANAEIFSDADILGRVEQYGGLTVEDIAVGEGAYANLLITEAASPIPDTVDLSNGEARLLVATVITDDEMAWSITNSREALKQELQKSGVGQLSELDRKSVFNPGSIDLSQIEDDDSAQLLVQKGLLRKAHLFPLALGGEDSERNVIYLPRNAALDKKGADERVLLLAQEQKISNYSAKPEYKGKSIIPSVIEIESSGEGGFVHRIEVW